MDVWLQYLALVLSVLAIVGLLGAGVFWKRLIDLLVTQIALSKQTNLLFRDIPKTMSILARLETASEEGRLSNDLLSLDVKHLGEHQTEVAADLLSSRIRAEDAAAAPDAEAGAAADEFAKLSQTGKLKLPGREPE